MIKNVCEHVWEKHINSSLQKDTGVISAFYICQKCNTVMTAPEVFQLEALENQNETLKNIKGFQKYISIIAVIISFIALLISIIK